ncbi:MAG: metallophosphoesterase [Acutalibacteraceae bacterium]|nr:metallophosphoesterase [Acutalibacteraceae bacterium]
MRKSNEIRFRPDGKLIIMQVSDPQDMKYVRKAMVKMLDNAYDKIKPDLVVFTGDNILGNHLLDARFGTKQIASGKAATLSVMKDSIRHICEPLEKRKIPFAMIYGNHDDMNAVSKDEQADIYRSYSMCMPMNTRNGKVDCDTYNIPVYSHDGDKPLFNLWMLDSAWYDKIQDKCFQAIKPETVEWYKKESARLTSENGGKPVPSLMFAHIPLPEIMNLIELCGPDAPGAVPCKDGWCRLKDDVRGQIGECPCILEETSGLFDAALECGDVKAVVSGHDHRNCFEGNYKGIDFIQTSCASFRCYGDRTRGVRVFEINERDPGDYITYFFNYDELCGRSAGAKLRYFWDADEKEKQKFTVLAGAAAVTAGVIGALIKKK